MYVCVYVYIYMCIYIYILFGIYLGVWGKLQKRMLEPLADQISDFSSSLPANLAKAETDQRCLGITPKNRKLEHQLPHTLKVQYKESSLEASLIHVPTFRCSQSQ